MSYTRVTTAASNQNILNQIMTGRSRLNDLSIQVSSGVKVEKASDDASAAVNILNSNVSLNKIDTYLNNISSASSEMETVDTQLQSVVDIIDRAKVLATSAANEATMSESELSSVNEEIKQLMDDLKSIANTQFGNTYVFGGTNTENAPYSSPADGEYQYSGTSQTGNYQRNVEISDGVTVTVNIPGDKVFGYYYTDNSTTPATVQGEGLFKTLATLSQSLESGDYDSVRSSIDELDTNLNTVLTASAQVGGVENRLTLTKTKLSNDKINLKSYKSDNQDVDMASAISDLSYQETALQASMQVSTKIMGTSLLDYI